MKFGKIFSQFSSPELSKQEFQIRRLITNMIIDETNNFILRHEVNTYHVNVEAELV